MEVSYVPWRHKGILPRGNWKAVRCPMTASPNASVLKPWDNRLPPFCSHSRTHLLTTSQFCLLSEHATRKLPWLSTYPMREHSIPAQRLCYFSKRQSTIPFIKYSRKLSQVWDGMFLIWPLSLLTLWHPAGRGSQREVGPRGSHVHSPPGDRCLAVSLHFTSVLTPSLTGSGTLGPSTLIFKMIGFKDF